MPDIFVAKSKIKKKKPSPKPPVLKTQTGGDLKKKISKHYASGHSHNPFASFLYLPDNATFETQEKQEKIVLLLRRHPITNVSWIFIALVMIFAPLVLKAFPVVDFLPGNFQTVFLLLWYLITSAFIIESFLSWFFDVNIITDERIIDIDFHNIIYKEISDAKIDRIQDKTIRVGGVLRSLLNYGDVHIQTAAESREFDFLAVPKPDKVLRVLDDLILEEEQEKHEGRAR